MGQKEELFTYVREHHFGIGETLSFKCPHCGKDVVVELKALEGDPDMIEVYWGKDAAEIEDKRKSAEKET
jgi:hypothetical protein